MICGQDSTSDTIFADESEIHAMMQAVTEMGRKIAVSKNQPLSGTSAEILFRFSRPDVPMRVQNGPTRLHARLALLQNRS